MGLQPLSRPGVPAEGKRGAWRWRRVRGGARATGSAPGSKYGAGGQECQRNHAPQHVVDERIPTGAPLTDGRHVRLDGTMQPARSGAPMARYVPALGRALARAFPAP